MSKIGKKPIKLLAEVIIEIDKEEIKIKNKNGEIKLPILKGVRPILENGELRFELIETTKQARSNWGTIRSLVANAVKGLTEGFERRLILEGVGYRINKEGEDIVFNLGFSHLVHYKKPAGVLFELEKNSILKIKGIDKSLVNQVAADIRSLKKPEPYKGKGFRYSDEVIRRKASKKTVGQIS